MTRATQLPPGALSRVVAPMVDACDLPFRLMCIKGGATCTYTQMYTPDKLFHDTEYRERALRDLHHEQSLEEHLRRPVVVQLGGRDIPSMVEAAKLFAPLCDGIDINCGCPQDPIVSAGYGSALLARKEWNHLESMLEAIISTVNIPVSAKIRLCQPVEDTLVLAKRLEATGISHITLHARFPSAKHRRHGAAKLEHVNLLVSELGIPVVSNGNVRGFSDLQENLVATQAAGLMVAEELLRNPYLFSNVQCDPFSLTSEYLELCASYPGSSCPKVARQHIRYFFKQSYLPLAWSGIIKNKLSLCEDLDELGAVVQRLEPLLRTIGDCQD